MPFVLNVPQTKFGNFSWLLYFDKKNFVMQEHKAFGKTVENVSYVLTTVLSPYDKCHYKLIIYHLVINIIDSPCRRCKKRRIL